MEQLFTIAQEGRSKVNEKMSRFYGFALHASTETEAKEIIRRITNEYHDARHVCWAYSVGVGSDRRILCNDNGEPSGTAGKPILGQINSFTLTDVVVVVVRYFGGIKLGTGGLTVAYRVSAREAIEDAQLEERHIYAQLQFTFPYMVMNDVMKIAKQPGMTILEQQFDNTCSMTLQMKEADFEATKSRLLSISGLTL